MRELSKNLFYYQSPNFCFFFQDKKNMASLKFHSVAIWFSLSLNLLQYTRLIRFTIHFRMILNVLPATSELSLPLNRKTRLNVRNKRHFVYCVWCKRKTVEIPMNNHTQTSVCWRICKRKRELSNKENHESPV